MSSSFYTSGAYATNGNGKSVRSFPPGRVARDVGELTHDAIELGELQFDLFKIEAKQAALGFVGPIVLFAVAALTILSALPLFLFFVASALVQWADWQDDLEPWAYLTAFGIGFVITIVLGLAGFLLLKRKLSVFRASREELSKNLDWIKSSLKDRSKA